MKRVIAFPLPATSPPPRLLFLLAERRSILSLVPLSRFFEFSRRESWRGRLPPIIRDGWCARLVDSGEDPFSPPLPPRVLSRGKFQYFRVRARASEQIK